jgi:cold shock CspA family protein
MRNERANDAFLSLAEGQRVSFDVQPDAKGAKAANLKSV